MLRSARPTWAGLAAPLLALWASAGLAAEPDLRVVGRTAAGMLVVDKASQHNHHSHGLQRVLTTVELSVPRSEPGRTIARTEETWDWDCEHRRYRVVERILRSDSSEYLGRESVAEGWREVPDSAEAERAALELVCPSAAKPLPEAPGPSARRRSEAQVIEMPRGGALEDSRR